MQRRSTKQKDIVYNTAITMYHPTAEEVYKKVQSINPKISRSTVFRNMNLFAQQGEFIKVYFLSQPTRYDTTAKPHNHCVCNICGKIIDLGQNSYQELPEVDFDVENCSITYYGCCRDCKK